MKKSRVVGKRILLADDQPAVRQTLKLMLNLDDHTVTEACNGKEALDLFGKGRYDLVITDYCMPEMPGNELAKEIKSRVPNQPIIMVTAYAGKLGSIENPVDAILNKPFTFEELRQAVSKLLADSPPGAPAK